MRLAALLALAIGALAPRASAQAAITGGRAPPGYALAVATADGVPRVLCEPACTLTLPRGEVRVGWRQGDEPIAWQRTLALDRDLRLDVRLEDRSAYRGLGHALLVAGGVLIATAAIVGIATEPEPPEVGWFGPSHGLVFAGIAGGLLLAFGVPGVALALVFERDAPALDVVPVDADEAGEDGSTTSTSP